VGTAAWSVPVITVVSAAPAFAVSGETLTATSPLGGVAADQLSTSQNFTATLSGPNVNTGRQVLFTISPTNGGTTDWLTFTGGTGDPSSVTVSTTASGPDGVATTVLNYGASKPATGSTYTITATLVDDIARFATWTLTYTALPNLAVVRVGTGTGTLGSTGTAGFVDEYAVNSATRVSSTAMPTVTAGSNRPTLFSGSATSDGALSLATNGAFLTYGGYAGTLAQAGIATSSPSTTPRVPALVTPTPSGYTLDTSTGVTNTLPSGNLRSVVTTDGSFFYMATSAGVFRVPYATAPLAGQIATITSLNTRWLGIYDSVLYYTTGSGTQGIYSLGTLPTSAVASPTLIAGLNNPYGFVFFDLDPTISGVDTLYIADDSAAITKFTKGAGGTWTSTGSVATAARGLTGRVRPDGSVVLFATNTTSNANDIVRIIDTSGYGGTLSGSTTVVATAASNTAFRGVAFEA
jgi:hypothetical protein